MNIIVKVALVISTALALSGCNMVITDKPMFNTAGGLGAPPIHPGVWRDEIHDCDFDEGLPQNNWPLCSQARLSVADPPFWHEVAGEPVILQAPIKLPDGKKSDTIYLYVAIRPLKIDAEGRIVAMKSWPVRCGPAPALTSTPSAPLALSHKPDSMTDAEWADLQTKLAKLRADVMKVQAELNKTAPTTSPLPGLKMDKNTGGCSADSVASLRAAAKASEAWASDSAVSHWVRDRGPGDKPAATQAILSNLAGG